MFDRTVLTGAALFIQSQKKRIDNETMLNSTAQTMGKVPELKGFSTFFWLIYFVNSESDIKHALFEVYYRVKVLTHMFLCITSILFLFSRQGY